MTLLTKKIIELATRELSVADYSNFELNLILNVGRITATVKACSANGMQCVRLTNPVIMFDETRCPEARIERLFRSFGFRRRAPL
jgi:hypothetical protein